MKPYKTASTANIHKNYLYMYYIEIIVIMNYANNEMPMLHDNHELIIRGFRSVPAGGCITIIVQSALKLKTKMSSL